MSPSWVEACRKCNELVLVDEYEVTESCLSEHKLPAKFDMDPGLRHLLSPSDPLFSSSQRDDDCNGSRFEKSSRMNKRKRFSLTESVSKPKAVESNKANFQIAFSGFDVNERKSMIAMVKAISSRTNSTPVVVDSNDPSVEVSHLVVPGSKRTLRVVFGLLRGIHIVMPEFITSALDGTWKDESDFAVPDRDWAPQPQRKICLRGFTVFVDPKLKDPSPEVLQSIIELAGGEVVASSNRAQLIISGHRSSGHPSDLPRISPGDLFDIIESKRSISSFVAA